jgi:hypothetical protein
LLQAFKRSKGPGFAGAFFCLAPILVGATASNFVYTFPMSRTTEKTTRVMPSATPTEAELEAWAALPRDEQVRRYQEMFKHPDCNNFTTDTPDDILAAARQRVAARRNG